MSQEQRYALLVNAVTDYAIYMLDPDGRIATWNAGAQRFKGYSAEEIVGEHFSRFFTPDDAAAGRPAEILRIAEQEGRFEGEEWRVRKNGTRFLCHIVVDPIRDDDGTLLGFAKVTRDVTDRKAQERALFDSEQRFRLLVQGVHDYAIYMLDTEGRVSNWNSGAEAIKGYSADEIVGRHFSTFYTEDDRRAGEPERALRTALEQGKYEREAWRVRKDGTLFWAVVVIDPIYDESGTHVGFAKITRDATDRKNAEDELERARAELAQSQRLQAIGELTGGIAHDFNNLMTVIAGSVDFLRQRPDLAAEKRAQHLDAIAETADRAIKLTDQLLAFGRRKAIKPEVIRLDSRLDALGEVLTRTLGSRIAVRVEPSESDARVEADLSQLETAILNAAFNARDAMPDGGVLTLSAERMSRQGAQCVRIAIRDTGLGMPQRVIDRAFEPFFTTKEVGKGTGLGLSQIHGFAAQACGHAEIDSREGEGTTISIILPASDKEQAAPGDEQLLGDLPPGLRVLLVEDSAPVRRFAEELLTDLGCEPLSVGSAEEALDLLGRTSVDLLLTDIVMPKMSGVELARAARAAHPDLPVVLATGYSDEIIQKGSHFQVVAKPYSAQALTQIILTALGEVGSAGRAATG